MALRRIAAIVTFTAALCAAPSAHAVVREIGAPEPFPLAGCPDNCQAIGQVSGFQKRIGEHRNPFRSNRPGHIVAFTIRLGQPNAEQMQFFQNFFGGPPSARLSILRPKKGKHRFKLIRQSEVFQLANYLGSTPSFALRRRLKLLPKDVVGLTTSTWVPAFSVGLGEQHAWRSSRPRSVCDATTAEPSAQQTKGSLRTYGCFYRDARLLYSATFVPLPSPTTGESRRKRRASRSGAPSGSIDTRTGGARPR